MNCPACGTAGADPLFVGVACSNASCQWYVEQTDVFTRAGCVFESMWLHLLAGSPITNGKVWLSLTGGKLFELPVDYAVDDEWTPTAASMWARSSGWTTGVTPA